MGAKTMSGLERVAKATVELMQAVMEVDFKVVIAITDDELVQEQMLTQGFGDAEELELVLRHTLNRVTSGKWERERYHPGNKKS